MKEHWEEIIEAKQVADNEFIGNLLKNIKLVAARWTGYYGVPRFYRSPINKGEEESNKLVMHLLEFCKYQEEKNSLPKNILAYRLFDRESYNELIVGGHVVEKN